MRTEPRLVGDPERDRATAAMFTRWYRLRRSRPDLVPPLLQEGAMLWTFTNPLDAWGSKERLAFDDFARMVEGAEAIAADARGVAA